MTSLSPVSNSSLLLPDRCTWPSYYALEPYPTSVAAYYPTSWSAHVFAFGILFALVAAHALFCLLRLWNRRHLVSKAYYLLLNILVGVTACSRSIYLLLDAYNAACKYPVVLSFVFYSIVFPCLTACISLLLAALLQAVGGVAFLPRSIISVPVVLCFTVFHLAISLVAYMTAHFYPAGRVILFSYQIFTVFWGVFLCASYVTAYRHLHKKASRRQTYMNKMIQKTMGLSTKHSRLQKLTLVTATNGMLIVVVLGLLLSLLEGYRLVQLALPSRTLAGIDEPSDIDAMWQWWLMQNLLEFVEWALCLSLSYLSLMPFRYTSPTAASSSAGTHGNRAVNSRHCLNRTVCFYFAPCGQLCWEDDTEYLLPIAEWRQLQDSEVSDSSAKLHQVKRQESTKSDLYPLHLISRSTDALAAAAAAFAGSALNANPAMLAEEKGELLWKRAPTLVRPQDGDDDRSDISQCENPHFYHSATDISRQVTLKVDRGLADAFSQLQMRSSPVDPAAVPLPTTHVGELGLSPQPFMALAANNVRVLTPSQQQRANERHSQLESGELAEALSLLAAFTDKEDDTISQLSLHVDDGHSTGEFEAHV